ncbi:MAG: TetR/AcrR family transcriptional regulator [Solirubrobacteraceae bacterium]|jgi:TetR/AcrR family transcriptional regulator, regulator of autoinduction and epiphytic fitness
MELTASDDGQQPVSRLSRRRNRRKAQIVRVAIEMLATSGYQGMSLEGVAERTDIAKATLYHYFSSKDELVAEALEALATAVLDRLIAVRDAAGSRSRRECLRVLVREQLQVLTVEFPEVGSIFSSQSTWPSVHDEARKSMRRRHDAIFREIVDAGVDAGEFDCDDVDVALQCHHAVMNSVSLWIGRSGDPAERAAAIEAVVRAVMRIFTTTNEN